MSDHELTEWQLQIRERALKLQLGEAPRPWKNHQTAYAAGIFAAGWTSNSEFVMASGDGYSITNPITGTQLLFDTDADAMFENIDEDNSQLLIPRIAETIRLFGLRSGDGLRTIRDWSVELIYPYWPNSMVVMYQSSLLEWETVYALKIDVSDSGNWRSVGFSPNHKTLAVVGHAGADFFSRID
jgi:hypothetical protein